MKAEHRHELKTNALADMMARAGHALKTGPSRHGLLIAGVAAVVIAAVGLVYFLWKNHTEAGSALWLKVDEAERRLDVAANGDDIEAALKDFKKLADDNPGTLQARVVRFDRARALLRGGLERLGSQDRDKALKDVKEAREIYAKLAADPAGSDNDPLLIQEALMAVAKADESLGDVEGARKGYRKLADAYPGTFLGKAAEERATYLSDENNRKQVEEFYAKFDKEANKPLTIPGENPEKK